MNICKHGEHTHHIIDLKNGEISCFYCRAELRHATDITLDDVRVFEYLNDHSIQDPTETDPRAKNVIFAIDAFEAAADLDLDRDTVHQSISKFREIGVLR